MNKEQMVKVLARTEEDRIGCLGELSDHHKNVYGFRPQWSSIKDMTHDQIDNAHKELSKMFETEQEAVKHYKKKMLKTLSYQSGISLPQKLILGNGNLIPTPTRIHLRSRD